jgi:hypothetical protein
LVPFFSAGSHCGPCTGSLSGWRPFGLLFGGANRAPFFDRLWCIGGLRSLGRQLGRLQDAPRFLFSSGPLHPLPRRPRLAGFRHFGVGLRIGDGGTQAFAGLARVEFQFVTDGLEGNDVGHVDLLRVADEDR